MTDIPHTEHQRSVVLYSNSTFLPLLVLGNKYVQQIVVIPAMSLTFQNDCLVSTTTEQSTQTLRMNSSLLSSIPWYTSILRDSPKLAGSFQVANGMQVSFNSFPDTSSDHLLKDFISGIDQHESCLFSSRSFTRSQDLQIQRQMGIEVTVEVEKEVVGPCPNFLSQDRLNPAAATRLFSVFCGYRLVDVLAFMGGTCRLDTTVDRTVAPTGPLPVRTFSISSRARSSTLYLVFRRTQRLGYSSRRFQTDCRTGQSSPWATRHT